MFAKRRMPKYTQSGRIGAHLQRSRPSRCCTADAQQGLDLNCEGLWQATCWGCQHMQWRHCQRGCTFSTLNLTARPRIGKKDSNLASNKHQWRQCEGLAQLTLASATSSAVKGGCMPQRQLLSFCSTALHNTEHSNQCCSSTKLDKLLSLGTSELGQAVVHVHATGPFVL